VHKRAIRLHPGKRQLPVAVEIHEDAAAQPGDLVTAIADVIVRRAREAVAERRRAVDRGAARAVREEPQK
jgi:hypothetical protein